MSTQDSGGYAFPQADPEPGKRGMSLRDYFAGQALAGFLALHGNQCSHPSIATYSYAYADAMIAERKATA